jgi:hypothetical protein
MPALARMRRSEVGTRGLAERLGVEGSRHNRGDQRLWRWLGRSMFVPTRMAQKPR